MTSRFAPWQVKERYNDAMVENEQRAIEKVFLQQFPWDIRVTEVAEFEGDPFESWKRNKAEFEERKKAEREGKGKDKGKGKGKDKGKNKGKSKGKGKSSSSSKGKGKKDSEAESGDNSGDYGGKSAK